MNKIIFKYVAFFLGGGALGALTSSLYFKKKYEKIADEEIDKMQKYYEENFDVIYPEEDRNDENSTAPEEYLHNVTHTESTVINRKVDTTKVDYTKYYAAISDPVEREHPEDDEYEADYSQGEYLTRERNKNKEPRIIKAEDYGSEPGVEQVMLLYYTGDDVLADEEENVYEDLEEVRGMIGDALTKYGFKNNDESTVYVRNLGRSTEYCIQKVNGFYQDLVEKGVR